MSKTGLFFTYENVFLEEKDIDKNPLGIGEEDSPF